ncbi:MAG TPA: BTAD domain-containing putative transcriptional regulator [Actinoplanes sp.]|jgi:predicted ATPase/DNA-binding SARP family transcriptional activator
MEFRVLGTFEIADDDGRRDLAVGGELAVLVLLLLNAGRVVTAEALIDASLGERPPANPVNALQLRVSKLRRALQAAGVPDNVVITRRPGYLADVDPDRVDAHRFARLVGDARRIGDRDTPTALRLYEQALALWRGPALPEYSSQAWAVPEVTRLTELRMSALEERIGLELAVGRHAGLVSELEALVAAHPLRERLHGHLMRALYRSGRQADALAAYRRMRQLLDEELGIEPSPELSDLERAILRHDPAIAAPALQAARPSPALPARLTSFVGRARELEHVRGLVGEHRLVTLTGPGGVGKTSLAMQAARAADAFPDGVWLARLAGTTDESRVPAVVGEAVGLPSGPGGAVADQLVGHLRHRSALIVLDNCEHLADACARLAQDLLENCPQLRLLATSREPLGTPGEAHLVIVPLNVPPDDAAPAELPAYDAVRLFLDRAATARPEFRLDSDSAAPVLRICRQLDGIPLAIELAAARVTTLPVAELADRLRDRFSVLTAGPRTADRRQQTLRAAVDWSHRLLSDPEKVLFRRLAVFRGGWTLAAAEEVCAGDELSRADVFQVLAHLVDRSLVVADHGEGPRFHLLETLRQYAAERLDEAGEATTVAAAHARRYTAEAEHGEPLLRGPDQGRLLRWLRTERDNIDAALGWCRSNAATEPDLGLRLVAALGWFWYFASRQDGGTQVAGILQAAAHGGDGPMSRALLAQAVAGRPGACIVHPDPDCSAAAGESLALLRRLGDLHRAAYAQTLLAVEGIAAPDIARSLAGLDEAEARFRAETDPWGRALVLFVRMELHFAAGAPDAATESAHRALELFRSLDDHWGISAVQYHLGLALHRAGQWEQARSVYEGALDEGRRVGLANTVQHALAHLGHVALALGDPEQAERYFAESHVTAVQLGSDGNPVAALGEGLLARRRSDLPAARRHYAAAQRLAQHKPDWTAAALNGLGALAEHEGDLDAATELHLQAWRLASEAGATGPTAAALEGLAAVQTRRGDAAAAATLLGTAGRLRQTRHAPATPAEREDLDRVVQACREHLGDRDYEAAYTAVTLEPERLLTRLSRPSRR